MSTRLFRAVMFILGLSTMALALFYLLPVQPAPPRDYTCDREVDEDASWPVILDEGPADDRCECGPDG